MTKIYQPKIIKPMEGDIKKYHKTLLQYGGFEDINDAKRQTGDNANQIYSHLFNELHNFIFDSNQQKCKKHHRSIAQHHKEKNEKKKLENNKKKLQN